MPEEDEVQPEAHGAPAAPAKPAPVKGKQLLAELRAILGRETDPKGALELLRARIGLEEGVAPELDDAAYDALRRQLVAVAKPAKARLGQVSVAREA